MYRFSGREIREAIAYFMNQIEKIDDAYVELKIETYPEDGLPLGDWSYVDPYIKGPDRIALSNVLDDLDRFLAQLEIQRTGYTDIECSDFYIYFADQFCDDHRPECEKQYHWMVPVSKTQILDRLNEIYSEFLQGDISSDPLIVSALIGLSKLEQAFLLTLAEAGNLTRVSNDELAKLWPVDSSPTDDAIRAVYRGIQLKLASNSKLVIENARKGYRISLKN